VPNRRLRQILVKLGLPWSVAVLTAGAIAASWFISAVVHRIIGTAFFAPISILRSTLVPALVAPPIAFFNTRLVLELHEMEERFREQATVDVLTGVLTLREFLRQAEATRNLCSRSGLPFSLVYIDVDHFKSINDRYGHPVGDRVLTRLGELLKNELRSCDPVGRIGGEEFAVALASGPDDPEYIAEKLRLAVADSPIRVDRTNITMTVSLGVASLGRGESLKLDILREHADAALYRAKRDGRNRTRVFRPDPAGML